MKARFQLQRLHEPVIELEPEHGDEALLMAAFIRFDANSFSVSVERHDDGQIHRVIVSASQAS